MCGEKCLVQAVNLCPKGSPPRVRGKDWAKTGAYNAQGITPACAGKSDSALSAGWLGGDHPRVCGEKTGDNGPHLCTQGSPPRVRGKGGQDPLFPRHPGITPACAGKRYLQHRQTGAERDHPRVCGEKVVNFIQHCQHLGSPPRVRGKAAACPVQKPNPGITPACAGKSDRKGEKLIEVGDHPRVCGEKSASSSLISTRSGSPPRVRGKVPTASPMGHL